MNQEPYTTVESVYGYMNTEAPSESSAEFQRVEKLILAMSAWIDQYCGRNIYRQEESTMKYDGDGSDMIIVKDVIDPVVTIDGVEREVFTYPQSKPYASRIRLDGWRFTKGIQNIHVTGVHSTTLYLPEEVQHACNVLVTGAINAAEVQGKVGTTERIGEYSVTYKDEAQKTDFDNVKLILGGYKRITL